MGRMRIHVRRGAISERIRRSGAHARRIEPWAAAANSEAVADIPDSVLMNVAFQVLRQGDVPRQSASLNPNGFLALSRHMALSFFNKKKKEKKERRRGMEIGGGGIWNLPRRRNGPLGTNFPLKSMVALSKALNFDLPCPSRKSLFFNKSRYSAICHA